MKLFKKLMVIFFTLFIVTIVTQSCCEEKYKIEDKGKVTALGQDFEEINTVNGGFIIDWRLEVNVVSNFKNLSPIQSCYALTCSEVFINELVKNTFNIKCDKDFTYNSFVIPAGTNFSFLYNENQEEDFKIFIQKDYGHIEIMFSDKMMENTVFEKGNHTFTLSIETTDGQEFENSIQLYMDIN